MCTSSCWFLFLVQFKSQVTFLLVAKVRVRVSQSSPAFERTEEGVSPRGVRSGVVVDDLPGSSVARHSSLRCSCIRAHLQADDVFAFSQLFVWEVSSVLLGLPAHTHTHTHTHTNTLISVYSVIPRHWNETFFCLSNFPQVDQFELTYGTSWGLLCSTHRSLSQPSYPEPSGSSGQQPGPCLKTCNNLTWTEPTLNIRTRSVLFTTEHSFTFLYLYCKTTVVVSCACWLTFKEVHSLKHVSFGDSIFFCSLQEQRYLLHLLEGHAGLLDDLDRLVGCIKAVDELRKHLHTHTEKEGSSNSNLHDMNSLLYLRKRG